MEYILQCLPCLGRRRDSEDPERQRLFPPPDTILTPPRPRHSLPPIHPGVASATSSAPISPKGWASPGLNEVSRERIGTISRAYQGRMMPLTRQSYPGSTTSSTAPTPHPTRTTFSEPHRPAAPNLGRSTSEPRSLHVMGRDPETGFAPHQIPPTGVKVRRPRSATAIDRMTSLHSRQSSLDALSSLHPFSGFDHYGRGRSPGPSTMGRSVSAGHLSGLATPDISEEDENVEGDTVDAVDVVHKDLGLKNLAGYASVRRGRGRSRARGASRTGSIRRVTS